MDIRDFSRNDILRAMGLETRREFGDYFWPALGIFSVGMLVGSSLGVFFAPKSGREMRDEMTRRMRRETGMSSYPSESETRGFESSERTSNFHS